MNYLSSHWLQITAAAGVAATVISEAMPFLPTKYNGIAEALVGVLRGKKPDAPQS